MTDLLPPPAPPGPPRIDPRFARRWIEARREEGRRRLQILTAVGVFAAVAGLAFGSLYTPLFDVHHLRVTVDGPLSAGGVARLSGVSTRTPMIEVHPGAIAARLDADPWLGGAQVVRSWPGTVRIRVAVRDPLAVVAAGGSQWFEVDATGRVLGSVPYPPPGMPHLVGVATVPSPGGWLAGAPGPGVPPDPPASRLADLDAASDGTDVPSGPAAALSVLASLPAALRPDINSIQAGPGAPLSLVMAPPRTASGTVTVLLGDGSQLGSKVTALLTLLGQGDLGGAVGLDLSVPSRPAAVMSAATLNALMAPGGPAALVGSGASGSGSAASGSGSAASGSGPAASGSATGPAGVSPTTAGPFPTTTVPATQGSALTTTASTSQGPNAQGPTSQGPATTVPTTQGPPSTGSTLPAEAG